MVMPRSAGSFCDMNYGGFHCFDLLIGSNDVYEMVVEIAGNGWNGEYFENLGVLTAGMLRRFGY